jgi:hypothetical protein
MKTIAKLLLLTCLSLTVNLSWAQVTKKVCNAQKDKKDKKGKEVQVCKEVRVHKKLDGTKVPPK